MISGRLADRLSGGLITPWNFPAAMITRKIGPALAAGCTVVAKSPGETPFTAAALIELGHRAGIPAGVINIVTALENTIEVGEAITSSNEIKKVRQVAELHQPLDLGVDIS